MGHGESNSPLVKSLTQHGEKLQITKISQRDFFKKKKKSPHKKNILGEANLFQATGNWVYESTQVGRINLSKMEKSWLVLMDGDVTLEHE